MERMHQNNSNKKDMLALKIAIGLLLVGVICYAAYPVKAPESPYRIHYSSIAGNVLFSHKAHNEYYDISCETCHHHPFDDPVIKGCGVCHQKTESLDDLPDECLDCHGEGEVDMFMTPDKSRVFHMKMEELSDPEYKSPGCVGCHEVNGIDRVECSSCHAM